ncbi:MAG: DUF177 domain-containing protein [Elusimicrobiota bacterium]|jgi:uncharacterized metal-binding protein YceD (DUF177 family)|nr:DUF177 domain-containing protein [Elusimicrobiota bacterium]
MRRQDYEIPKNLIFETRDIIDMRGLNLTLLLNPPDFDDILDKPAKITRAQLKLKFSVLSKEILAQGEVAGKASLQCSRCLETFEAEYKEEFTRLYSIKDEIIDIMSITKQTLALLADIQNLCRPDCKGLCSFCGANKNETQCGCKPPVFSQFACLKDLKTKE